MRCRYLISALALIVLLLAGCGGHTITVTRTVTAPANSASSSLAPSPSLRAVTTSSAGQCAVAPGEGFMGACVTRPAQVYPGGQRFALRSSAPAGCRFPDVSSWQGAVHWPAVASWQRGRGCHPAAVFKLGEYSADPFAARNASETARLGFWRAGYWFVRNTGCQHEAGQIIASARALRLRVVFEDDEVPEARGYDGCLTPILKRAGLIVGEYASPGAYPGGAHSSNPAWIAAYGPSAPPPAPWGGPIVAFQCTDGIFGCVTPIPGLGNVDVSVDLGITKLGAPVDPLGYLDKTKRHLPHGVVASEYGTVGAYRRAHCRKPERRSGCRSSVFHDRLLEGRLFTVSQHKHPHYADGRGRRLHTLRAIDKGH